jgi:hypothetical protein
LKTKKDKKHIHANALEKNKKVDKKESESDSKNSNSAGEALETYLCELNSCELETHAFEKQKNHIWILDSGATHHVTGNPQLVHNLQKVSQAGGMTAVGGETHKVASQGDILVKFHDGEIKHIKSVLYVPGIHRNLLSVGRIADQGYSIEFTSSKVTIQKQDTQAILCHGRRMSGKGLYSLGIACISTLEACTVEADNSLQQALLLYKHLRHVNFNTLHKMSKEEMVSGILRIPKIEHICDTCQLGKLIRKKFDTNQCTTSGRLELIRSDLCGPIRAASVTVTRYFITFSDDFSRKTWIYLLKTKDQAYDRFVSFKAIVENQLGVKIKILRTDNGGEYTSKKFQNFCE